MRFLLPAAAVIAVLVLAVAYSSGPPAGKACSVYSDCVVFGKTGDCNCGCYTRGKTPAETEGKCFCMAPVMCKCVNSRCEGVFQGEITDFTGCADAGYPVMESYPRQCRTPDGTLFVERI